MDKKLFKENLEQIDSYLKQEGISRRDAMKMLGLGGTAMMMGSGAVTEAKASSGAKGKILIVGGGLSGVATAALLMRTLENPDITILEPNPKSSSYQPGQTLVGGGVWTNADTEYMTADFMPDGVKWIKEKAIEFDPDKNSVKTDKGQTIKYDYMIVAAGLKLDFARLEGLGINETITSRGDSSAVKKVIGQNGLCSIYFADGATDTWTQMQKFVSDAKSGKKV
ncbi:MAG: FAD/NAD(P)-binding oxidoreductase, partial [Sulfurovaceae bacterium]|nr:FAD/NAD(P)-binding oxidoreductase [Sulfurovaceae bacterium]